LHSFVFLNFEDFEKVLAGVGRKQFFEAKTLKKPLLPEEETPVALPEPHPSDVSLSLSLSLSLFFLFPTGGGGGAERARGDRRVHVFSHVALAVFKIFVISGSLNRN
jgi:hypothetical protein